MRDDSQETQSLDLLTPAERIQAVADSLNLSATWEFVPFSKSRNRAEKSPSLNWRYILYQTRGVSLNPPPYEVISGDYMQGSGHCPASKATVKVLGGHGSMKRHGEILAECENGRAFTGQKISPPLLCDLLHSLLTDAGAIDHASYEDFAREYGYNEDSRKGEATYRACLAISLALRAAIGDSGIRALQEAAQDY